MSGIALVAAVVAVVGCVVLARLLVSTRREVAELKTSIAERPDPAPAPPPATAEAEPERPRPTTVVPYVITRDEEPYVPTPDQVRRAAMSQPMVRAVALSHGLRRAMEPANRDKVTSLMRREFRRRRKMRMRAGRRAARMARMAPVDGSVHDDPTREEPAR